MTEHFDIEKRLGYSQQTLTQNYFTSTRWNEDKPVLRRDHTLRRLESHGRSAPDTFSPTDDLLPLCPEKTNLSGAERRAESRS